MKPARSWQSTTRGNPIDRFGPAHLCALGVIAVACALVFMAARRGGQRGAAWVGRGLAAALLAFLFVTYQEMWRAHPPSLAYDLPLHLCDLILVLGFGLCFTRAPLLFELAWFWGLAGTAQALITPDLAETFPSFWYFQFFWGHGLVMALIAYGLGCGLRGRPGAPLRAFLALNLYAGIVAALDYAFSWNYGYLCYRPAQPSLIDHLGRWPWYILGLEAVAAVSFFALDLPWKLARRFYPADEH